MTQEIKTSYQLTDDMR